MVAVRSYYHPLPAYCPLIICPNYQVAHLHHVIEVALPSLIITHDYKKSRAKPDVYKINNIVYSFRFTRDKTSNGIGIEGHQQI